LADTLSKAKKNMRSDTREGAASTCWIVFGMDRASCATTVRTAVERSTGLWTAFMADAGATVLVTLNALRLLGLAGVGMEVKRDAA
jgi:hypothetical protein